MTLNIKDAGTDRLARELAEATGESLTRAIEVAVRERLERVRMTRSGRRLADELDEIAERCGRLPVVDGLSDEAILGYDRRGLPR